MNKLSPPIRKTVSILIAVLVWQAAAMLLNQSLLLVSPLDVIKKLSVLLFEKEFFKTVLFSLSRIVTGFICGFTFGIVLAVISKRFAFAETLLWPWMTAIKAVPVASFIILCLIWLPGSKLSVFISFLMVLPVIYTSTLEGLKSTGKELLEMAALYRMSPLKKALYVYMPQIKPFLISACSTALGLCWKSGIAAEVIGIPGGSIGERLYRAKVYFDTAELFSWTVVIITVSVVFEKLFLYLARLAFALPEKDRRR